MNKPLTHEELTKLATHLPITMTRLEKLARWADLIEAYQGSVAIYDRIEQQGAHWRTHPNWANAETSNYPGAIAHADATLREAGLAGPTPQNVIDFFELSEAELHEISCNCGGHISARDMAGRIRAIGQGGQPVNPPQPVPAASSGFSIGNAVARVLNRG